MEDRPASGRRVAGVSDGDEEVRTLKEEMRALRDTLVDGLVIIDEHNTIHSFNLAAERIFGHRAEEVIGQNVRILMPEPYQGSHDRYVENYVRTGHAKIIGIGREVTGLRKDGSTFPMHLAVGEMAHRDGRYFVGVIRDLTKDKEVQSQLRQAQKLDAIGKLTGGIAHDFNNLLSVLTMDLETLSDMTPAGDGRRELIEESLGITRSASQLTQQLLAFARKQPLNPKTVNINQFAAHFAGLLRRSIGESIRLETTVSDDLWHAKVDPNQLEHALLNLALNARDAMPGGGRLTIETRNVVLEEDYTVQAGVAPGEYVCVSVTDTGMGMPREVVEHAFEPFFTTKTEGKGSGMGLAMVYGFVRQSQGHVAIYSEPGLGTTVSLYFPHVRAEGGERAGAPPAAALGEGTILLVEDFLQLRQRTKHMLGRLGYNVTDVSGAAEALGLLSKGRRFDLLFTDVVMPGMNGYELADRARELLPGLRVVLASGYADADESWRVARDSPPEWTVQLRKPYSQQEVASAIRRVLGRAD
jgi:PAS domain S-box-containing protein